MENILHLELAGILFIFVAGSALHFVFDWGKRWRPLGIIAPVNESVWEHFKLSFWPGIIYALGEYIYLGASLGNFWFAKAIGITSMILIVGVVFYAYKAILGKHFLVIDISLFFVATAIGQILSYFIISGASISSILEMAGKIWILFSAVIFAVFTYKPPKVLIFKDTVCHKYGIFEK